MISGFHLYLALIGLYLLECVRITTANAIVFRRKVFSQKWSAVYPLKYPGADRWGWILTAILPAAEPAIVAEDFLVAYGVEQVAPNFALVASKSEAVAYAEIKNIAIDENSIKINGAKFVNCHSARLAQQIKGQIEQLREASPNLRETMIRRFANMALQPRARERLQSLRTDLRGVTAIVKCLWLTAFILLPIALLISGNDFVLVPVAALIWSLALALAFVVPSAKKRMNKSHPAQFSWESLKYILYPVAAIRALEDITRDQFMDIHPVALCTELCASSIRTRYARDLLLRIRHPVHLSSGRCPQADAVSNWFNQVLASCLEKHLAETAPEILNDLIPHRLDPSCASYCPRCCAQYRTLEGLCVDCPRVALQPFNAQKVNTPK